MERSVRSFAVSKLRVRYVEQAFRVDNTEWPAVFRAFKQHKTQISTHYSSTRRFSGMSLIQIFRKNSIYYEYPDIITLATKFKAKIIFDDPLEFL